MTIPKQQLVGATITRGPQAWQVLQREADGRAAITLQGIWGGDGITGVQTRVIHEYDGSAVAGCDWEAAEVTGDHAWRAERRVPTGGPFQVQARGMTPPPGRFATGDNVSPLFVGDLWIIAGQSNAVGYGHGVAVDPPLPGVSLFGRNKHWRLASHPISDPTGVERDVNREGGPVGASPWLAFGREILHFAGVPVGLIPTAYGGSALAWWEPGYQGEPPSLFANMVDLVEAAGGRVAGMVWYQGCSDASIDLSKTYLERFARFVGHVRKQFGADLPIITAQLNRYLDGTPDMDLGWSLLREAQRQAARVIPRVTVVPTLDIDLSDAIHNSAAGNAILGQRFGCIALGMVYSKESPWRPAEASAASFTDATKTAIRIEFNPESGPLRFLELKSSDFKVEDAGGPVPLSKVSVEGRTAVVACLTRPAAGETRCHLMPGVNPGCTLRDGLGRPPLAFHNLLVAENR